MTMPHCDPSVLHAPEMCQWCDHYPDWQEYRIKSRINFTGQDDSDKAPCPSSHFRSLENVERWGGNQALVSDSKLLKKFERLQRRATRGELF